MPINPMVPGGPMPAMPEVPPQDPSQAVPTDPTQIPPEDPTQVAPEGGDQPISEQQRQTLLDMKNEIRVKLGKFHATSFASKNKIEAVRSSILKQVFEKLQLAGVDLTDKDSVAAFLAKLQQTNPELATNFEQAMNVLLGGEGMQGAPQDPTQSMDLGIPPQNNMNNENQNGQPEQTAQAIPQS